MSDEFKYCNLNDYVSREALYIEFRRHFTAPENWRKLAKFVIDATPSANVAPVVHGRWIEVYENNLSCECLYCSMCGYREFEERTYCAHCGAKMDEEE